MLERKTILDQIEILSNGAMGIRLRLVIVDGDVEIASKFHRTIVDYHATVEEQMAVVNEHLAAMREATVSQEDIQKIAAYDSIDREAKTKLRTKRFEETINETVPVVPTDSK